MALYVDENEYPQNYDWLPQEKQQAIVDLANSLYKRRSAVWRIAHSKSDTVKKHRDFLMRQWESICEREDGVWDICDALGIKLEYGWVGHRDTYFLATYNDALVQQDYYDDIVHDAEGDVDQYRVDGDYDSEEIDY